MSLVLQIMRFWPLGIPIPPATLYWLWTIMMPQRKICMFLTWLVRLCSPVSNKIFLINRVPNTKDIEQPHIAVSLKVTKSGFPQPYHDVIGFFFFLNILTLILRLVASVSRELPHVFQQQEGRGEFLQPLFGRWKLFSRNPSRILLTFPCLQLSHIASREPEEENSWRFLPLDGEASSDQQGKRDGASSCSIRGSVDSWWPALLLPR